MGLGPVARVLYDALRNLDFIPSFHEQGFYWSSSLSWAIAVSTLPSTCCVQNNTPGPDHVTGTPWLCTDSQESYDLGLES